MLMFWGKKTSDQAKLVQLYINWFVLLILGVYMGFIFLMMFPTLHNFIVNPKSENCSEPGLGGSETLFSIAAGIYSGGAIFWCLFAFVLFSLSLLPFKVLVLLTIAVPTLGSLVYALATEVWMVIIARFFQGSVGSLALLTFIWYCVASVEQYDELCVRMNKPVNNRLKRQLTIIFSIVATGSYVVCLGIVSIVSQFPDQVNQFRFPAWFNLTLGLIFLVLAMVLFRDTQESKKICSNFMFKTTFKIPKMPNFTSIMVVLFLLYNAAIVDGTLTLMEAIMSLLLSRYFGFNISEISYFILGFTMLFPASCVILLVLERLRVSSRAVMLIALIMNIIGVTLLGDWQYIGNASVTQCSIHSSSINTSITDESSIKCTSAVADINQTLYDEQRLCIEDINNACYWNQESIVSGGYCMDCPAVCHSRTGSLNFIQFAVAIVLTGLSVDMVRYNTMPLMSKVVEEKYKFVATGMQIVVQSMARMVFPMWYVPLLALCDWHTVIPSSVILALHVPSLIGFFTLCSKMSGKYINERKSDKQGPPEQDLIPYFEVMFIETLV